MELVLILRWVHIIGATVLLGTGASIAFFMLVAHRTKDAKIIAHVAGTVVIADMVFTATAVILQPISGAWLAVETGWKLSEGWILASLALYVFIGVFWLPVVWIQLKMRNLAREADQNNQELPRQYFRLFRIWFTCGFPAFFAVMAILWLMIARPLF
ncbi:MAG: hypothetical protein COB78_12260 [Hyphomicrobiales bacterium]|nr:MAG: hypothetical protein COB78_12260 [Hyphomicrobiales bacterium]